MPTREHPEIYDLKYLKGFFRRRRKLFLIISSAIMSAAIVFTILAPRTYVSTATFLIEGQIPEDIVKGMSSGYIDERLQSITQQVLRRDKLVEIMQQFNLYGDGKDQADLEQAIKKMKEDVVVRTIRAEDLDKRPSPTRFNTVAFTLSYQGKDPETVQKVASRLASLYIEKNESAKEQFVAQTTAVLQQKLVQLKEQTDTLGQKLSDFKRQHAGEMPDSVSFNLEQIYRLNAKIEELNGKISMIEMRGKSPDAALAPSGISGSATTAASQNDPWNQLAQLKMQLVSLRAKYSEKHPDVIKTRNEIRQLEERLGATGDPEGTAQRDTELKRLTKQRDELQRKVAEFTRRNQVAPLLQTEYNRLTADYDSAVKQYNDARTKLADAKVIKKMDESQMGERFLIIDQPVVPQKPDKPKPLKILLAGLFASIFCGLFASILAENLDRSIKSAEHLQKITRLPVLTIMPLIRDDTEGKSRPGRKSIAGILEGLKTRATSLVSKGKTV
jgi:polysaccharide chain length determinant protein (PEP-CTERM system associated)